MFSINVLVVTYNQQDVIGRALDSILQQKDYGLKEIVIGDDCSTDNNWQVIQDYVKKYPGYIRAYRNEPNKGIYGNSEYVLSQRGNADFYMELAGDDALCDGFFEHFQAFAEENKNLIEDRRVTIYADYKTVYPNGKEVVFNNSAIHKDKNVISMKLRHVISGRSSFVSKSVVNCYRPIDLTCGLAWAEEQYDTQKQLYSDINLYFPYVGSIYYSGVGISLSLNNAEYFEQMVFCYNKCLQYYSLDKKDCFYMFYLISYYKFRKNKKISDFLKCRIYHLLSVKINYGLFLTHTIKEFYNMTRILLLENNCLFNHKH